MKEQPNRTGQPPATAQAGAEAAQCAVWSIDELAKILGVGRSTLYVDAQAGTLLFPVKRLGNRYLIPKRGVEAWLAGDVA